MTILTIMEKHLMGISKLLSYYGRLILVNSIYSAMPTFYMCTLKVPGKILAQIDKYLKHCLWNGTGALVDAIDKYLKQMKRLQKIHNSFRNIHY
jgi:hypothetical protein